MLGLMVFLSNLLKRGMFLNEIGDETNLFFLGIT
jgi:hypothetical protein